MEFNYYLLNLIRDKLEFPSLKKLLLNLAHQYKPTGILIEDMSSGSALLQACRGEISYPLIGIRSKLNKISRFSMATTYFEAGHVYLPEQAKWLGEYKAELMAFPYGACDDQVDSTSQFLNYIKNKKLPKLGLGRI